MKTGYVVILFVSFILLAATVWQPTYEEIVPNTPIEVVSQEQFVEEELFPESSGEPNVNPDELHCLAVNIYHEAKGESYLGKLAVAHVTMNRVHNKRFPDNVCDVVYQAQMYVNWKGNEVPRRGMCQFSWFCDGKSDDLYLTNKQGHKVEPNVRAWNESNDIAFDVLLGYTADPTAGATHYHNPSISDPFWTEHFELAAVVDNHTFYK